MGIVTVEGGLRVIAEVFIGFGFSSPAKIGPDQLGDVGVKVATFAGIEVSAVLEELPLNGTDDAGLNLLGVNLAPFHPNVGDEDRTKGFFDVL